MEEMFKNMEVKEMAKLTLQELESVLWQCADILRESFQLQNIKTT